MTQEQKDLLHRDLCARLPYGVKGNYQNSDDELLRKVIITYRCLEPDGMVMTEDLKPYLFPISSMSEEQKKEFDQLIELELKVINDEIDPIQTTIFEVDFYNKHHLDWRGLIPKGLAIDCTNLNIY